MSILKDIIQVGFLLGLIFGAVVFIPQIIRLLKTKSSEGVSLATFLGFIVTQILVLIHGFYYKDHLLIMGMALRLLVCVTLIYFIVIYRLKKHIKSKRFRRRYDLDS